MRARLGAAGFWLVAGAMHFVIPRQYEAIVPPSLARWKKETVVASGLAEIAGGIAILDQRGRARIGKSARDPAGGLPGEHPHGAAPGAVPEDPGSRALGAAACSRDLRFAHLARNALAVEADEALGLASHASRPCDASPIGLPAR